jgi:hypothetical protein
MAEADRRLACVEGRLVGAPRLMPVDSSVIAAVGYDDTQRTLYVRFNMNGMYVFHDVPPATYDAFMHADSKGRFFNAEIRNTYRYTRLDAG